MLYAVLRPMLLILVVAGLAFLVPGLIQRPVAGATVVGSEAALLIIALLVAGRGRVDVASGLTIVSFLGACLAAVTLFGGTQGAVATTLLPAVVLAGALRGYRAVIWSAGVVIVGITILGSLERLGHVPVMLPDVSVPGSVLVSIVSVALTVVFLALLVSRLREAQAQAEVAAADARAHEGRLSNLVHELPDGLVLLDLEGTFLECNPAVERMTGFTAEELVGRPLLEMPGIPDDATRAVLAASLGAVQETERDLVDVPLQRKDGTPWVVQAHARLVRNTRGEPWVQVSLRDVTVLREAEAARQEIAERAQEAERLETVGRLAGGVAHDFRNLLTAVFANAELLGQEGGLTSEQRTRLAQLIEAAERANGLTRQLLTFAGRQEQRAEVLDPGAALVGLEPLMRRLLREDIALQVTVPSEPLAIRADPSQLEQVVLNLITNARDAMPAGGRVTVEITAAELDVEAAASYPGARAGRYVVLAVTDTGEGMSPDTVERIFEPFFSTKPEGHGTGLGLATVHGVLKRHGGFVTVYSEPGRGACFKAHFLRVDEPPASPAPVVVAECLERPGQETVLVADDEPRVLESARRILESCGYRVLAAADGHAAAAMAQDQEVIHALVTDMVMPGPSGRELAALVRERHPDAVVIYMSGYTEDVVVSGGDLGRGERFLAKPFRLRTLTDTITELIAQR